MKIKFLGIALLFSLLAQAKPALEEGKAIFAARCAACHNVNKQVTGPALAGIDQRRSMDWIISFVHSSQEMVKQGDPVAVQLFNQFNNIPMPDHKDLTADNIKSIVEYIKSEAKTGGNEAPFAKPARLQPAYVPLTLNNYGFFIGYLALVGLLIAVLLFAVQTKEYERLSKKNQ